MIASRALLALVLALVLETTAACNGGPSSAALEAFPAPEAARVADAVLGDDAEAVTALVHGGASPSAVGRAGRSLLELAVLKDKPKAFAALLAAGADVAHADDEGDTVVHYAAQVDDFVFMNALLERKIDVNVVSAKTGNTPLMDAALTGHGSQLHGLLQAGARVDVAEPNGDTALILAAQANQTEAVLDLLAAGADPRAKNATGATFQRYLRMTPTNVLAPEARREREKIDRWLVGHDVPLET